MFKQRRYRHFLKPCTKQSWPTCVLAVDASTNEHGVQSVESPHHAECTGWIASTAKFSNGEITRTWHASGTGKPDWWKYLASVLRHHTNLWVVSWHTAKIAAVLGLWEEMEERRIYLVNSDPRRDTAAYANGRVGFTGYCVLQNPPTILCFKRKNLPGTVTWIDIRNFGYSRLTEIGSGSTLPQRILGTLTAIISFLRKNDLYSIRPTVASQALACWKYRYLKHTIHVSTNETQNNLAQDALYGGRTECFRMGRICGPVTQYDINSLYPAMYEKHSVPIRLRWLRSNPSNSDIAHAIRGKNCICRVYVESDVANVPKRDGRGTYFPVGRISTVLAWPELEIVLDTCKRIHFTEIATFDLEPALSEFADELYAERTKAKSMENLPLARYIKSLLVSLPGKFGQRQKRWQISENQNAPGPWEVWTYKRKDGSTGKRRSLAWTVEEEVDDGLSPESVPEIAAWVNSWGRRELWELMQSNEDSTVVYCDTDSVWTIGSCENYERRIRDYGCVGLGNLRKVSQYSSVTIHGLKHYVADEKTTCSGAGECYDMFGRWLYSVKPDQRIKPYTLGRVQHDLTVLPLICEDW